MHSLIRRHLMVRRNLLIAAIALSLFIGAEAVVNSQGTRKAKTGAEQAPELRKTPAASVAGVAVFAINKFSDVTTIDPIVIFNKGQYIDPIQDENQEFTQQVEQKYLRNGQKHRVIFGGAEAGTVTVGDRQEFGLTTSATLQSSVKLNTEVRALAT